MEGRSHYLRFFRIKSFSLENFNENEAVTSWSEKKQQKRERERGEMKIVAICFL